MQEASLYGITKGLYQEAVASLKSNHADTSPYPLDAETKAELWRRGFSPKSYYLYDMKTRGFENQLSDLQMYMCKFINGQHKIILEDKLAFYRAFEKSVPQPEIVAALVNETEFLQWPRWATLLRATRLTAAFVRPTRGGAGVGVRRVEIGDGAIHYNGHVLAPPAFFEQLARTGQSYVVTLAVDQHPTLAALNPGSVNTIRVLSARLPHSGERIMIGATLRIGTKQSGSVDNFAAGGVMFPIDLATGRAGKGVQTIANGFRHDLTHHPQTGAAVTGMIIPHWQNVVRLAQTAFTYHPALTYVGWDIAITPDGPTVIEGNSFPSINTVQAFGGILAHEPTRRFYEQCGILRFTSPDALP